MTDSGEVHPLRVLVVDDHEMFATSLAHVLAAEPDLRVVGTVNTLAAAKAAVSTSAPDVLLLDHRLPDGDGVAALTELRALRSGMQVLVLTASTSDSVLVAAMESGAAGFISKTQPLQDVVDGVRAAGSGEAVVSSKLLSRLLPRLRRAAPSVGSDLTERERDVLVQLADALPNAQIARNLGVSVHTVRNHVANLSSKLGAHSKLEVLAIAVREGLLPEA